MRGAILMIVAISISGCAASQQARLQRQTEEQAEFKRQRAATLMP